MGWRTRFLVTVVSAGAALTFVAASGLMNWVFMSSLGRSDLERQILGAVGVAVSVFIALLPTLSGVKVPPLPASKPLVRL